MSPVRFANRAEFEAAVAAGTFDGEAVHLTIMHDDACTPERCTCEPEYMVQDLTVENYKAGQRAQENWERTSRS